MVTHFKKLKKKDSSPGIFFYIFLAILVLTIAGFLLTSNLKMNKKRSELLAQINYLEKEIQIWEEKKQKLEAGILEKETENYLEKEARERLGLQKSGEEVVAVLPPGENPEAEVKKEKSFWERLLEKLGL